MLRKLKVLLLLVCVVMLATGGLYAVALEDEAEIINDEGGATLVTGELSYTLGFFTSIWINPYIVLYDTTGFIIGDVDFVPAFESQAFGFVTSDINVSPFSYQISLPAEPQGVLHNFGGDGPGVMVFALAIAENLWGDPFIERRDDFFVGYPSARIGEEQANLYEIIGGRVIVYAPDSRQLFPAGFGPDGKLFTEDDPLVTLPAGYTVVDLDTEPFTFDRARNPQVALLEAAGNEQDDFSALSYTEAFIATVEKLRREYAFTELKDIDWDALLAEFLPRFEEADALGSNDAYRRALSDFAWAIPDGHMFGPFLVQDFQIATSGGFGMAIRELDDGRVITNFILPGGPAQQAGIQLGAEITEVDGVAIDDAIRAIVPWSSPFSTEHVERLQQLRYLIAVPTGTDMTFTYLNPGDTEPTTVTLTAVAERQSFAFSSFAQGLTGTELPVEFRVLESGYGYIKIYSFFDDLALTTSLWERAIRTLKSLGVPGIILDMRQNGGGFTDVGYQMMAYFFDEELFIELETTYDESVDDFPIDERNAIYFQLPPEADRFSGPVAVLIAPSCASACEFVVRSMTLNNRAAIVGQYPTQGIAGGWQPFFMPDGEQLPAIIVRTLDENNEIIIEGTGIAPTVQVPVSEETLFSTGDPILEAAVVHLDGLTALDVVDGGTIALGESVTGDIVPRQRIRYTLEVAAGDFITINLGDESGQLDTYLRLYVAGSPSPAVENDDAGPNTLNSAIEELEIPQNLTLIVEVGTYNDGETGTYTLEIIDLNADE